MNQTERKQKEKEEKGLIDVILLAVTRRKGAKSLTRGRVYDCRVVLTYKELF